jgi:hypothetical protein
MGFGITALQDRCECWAHTSSSHTGSYVDASVHRLTITCMLTSLMRICTLASGCLLWTTCILHWQANLNSHCTVHTYVQLGPQEHRTGNSTKTPEHQETRAPHVVAPQTAVVTALYCEPDSKDVVTASNHCSDMIESGLHHQQWSYHQGHPRHSNLKSAVAEA